MAKGVMVMDVPRREENEEEVGGQHQAFLCNVREGLSGE